MTKQAAATSQRLSLRGAKRRGNPFFWQSVLIGTACTGYGLPRPLRGLAMTAQVVRPCTHFCKEEPT